MGPIIETVLPQNPGLLGSEEGRLAGLHHVSALVSGPCVLHVSHFIIIRSLQGQCECPDCLYEHMELYNLAKVP